VAAILQREGIEAIDHADRVIVPSQSAFGCTIAFTDRGRETAPAASL
jgi:hypothetical protein